MLTSVNVSIQLPDKRVLLRRRILEPEYIPKWSATVEKVVPITGSALSITNSILLDNFGIDPWSYRDSFAEITRHPVMGNLGLTLVTAKVKSEFIFTSAPNEQFMAVSFDDLIENVMMDATMRQGTDLQVFTDNTIWVVRRLCKSEVFD